MNTSRPRPATSWFATRDGRRYNLELALVVLAKLALLTILYFAFIAPQPRIEVTRGALQQHLFGTGSVPASGIAP